MISVSPADPPGDGPGHSHRHIPANLGGHLGAALKWEDWNCYSENWGVCYLDRLLGADLLGNRDLFWHLGAALKGFVVNII